jgi:hypothetical protein
MSCCYLCNDPLPPRAFCCNVVTVLVFSYNGTFCFINELSFYWISIFVLF